MRQSEVIERRCRCLCLWSKNDDNCCDSRGKLRLLVDLFARKHQLNLGEADANISVGCWHYAITSHTRHAHYLNAVELRFIIGCEHCVAHKCDKLAMSYILPQQIRMLATSCTTTFQHVNLILSNRREQNTYKTLTNFEWIKMCKPNGLIY